MNSKNLKAAIRRVGLKPYEYSGKFMFGETCVGVTVPRMGSHNVPAGFHWDNMADEFVLYWVNTPWTEK